MNTQDQAIADALAPALSDYQGRVNLQAAHERDAWIMRMAGKAGPIRPGLHTTLAYQGLDEFPD